MSAPISEYKLGEGIPLVVCVNDCMLDCGQPASELMPICFRVQCAFAVMRWGPGAAPLQILHSDVASNSGSHRLLWVATFLLTVLS